MQGSSNSTSDVVLLFCCFVVLLFCCFVVLFRKGLRFATIFAEKQLTAGRLPLVTDKDDLGRFLFRTGQLAGS